MLWNVLVNEQMQHLLQDLPELLLEATLLPCRCSQIYQPVFVNGGSAVASGGQGSGLLSLYCTNTGATISRGSLGYDPSALCAGRGGLRLLACATNRCVMLLQGLPPSTPGQ